MAIPGLAQLWTLGRRVEALFELQKEAKDTFKDIADRFDALESKLDARIRAVEDRLTKLDASEARIISDAKREAAAEATRSNNDIVTRLTKVEFALTILGQVRSSARAIRHEGSEEQ
jgi:uncharacterized protein YPO0396